MTKIEEDIVYNYLKSTKELGKKIVNINCNFEILEDIEKSEYLNNDNKKELIKIETNLKNLISKDKLNYRIDKYILYSKERVLSYLIGINEKNKVIAIETDFENDPIIILSNKESYIISNTNIGDITNYEITLVGKNITGKCKDLISVKKIIFIDTVGCYQVVRKIISDMIQEFPNKEKKLKKSINNYSAIFYEIIFKNETEFIYKNKITNEEIIINSTVVEIINEYLKDETEVIEFFLKKQFEEKPELTEEERKKIRNVFFNLFKYLKTNENTINVIEN